MYGPPVGQRENAHGPAAGTRQGLGGRHVGLVDGGVFFPVDLDRHKVLVEVGGNFRVVEGLPCHHVAPMAGRIANGEEHRDIPGSGLGECFLGVRPPIHGLVRMLSQIGRSTAGDSLTHGPEPTARSGALAPNLRRQRRCLSGPACPPARPAGCPCRVRRVPAGGLRPRPGSGHGGYDGSCPG